jgi:hypothetical protein
MWEEFEFIGTFAPKSRILLLQSEDSLNRNGMNPQFIDQWARQCEENARAAAGVVMKIKPRDG